MSDETNTTQPAPAMSTADVLNGLGLLLQPYRALRRADELFRAIAGGEQRLAELDAAAAAKASQIAALEQRLAELALQVAEAERTASDYVAEQAERKIAAKADTRAAIAAAEAERDQMVGTTRRDTERQVAELAASIAERRAELAGVEQRLAAAQGELAALRAKLGA